MKMTKEELEKDYYADRPIEPYSDDDSPNDWANIAHYAEENLEKAFKHIAELKAEVSRLKLNEQLAVNNGKTLLKENAELKRDYDKRGSTIISLENQLRMYVHSDKTDQLTKSKEIIKKFLLWENSWHSKTESKYELLKQAEQFLKEISE